MAGSSSCMSWTSTPARRWRSPSPAGSTPTPPSRCSTGWSPNAAPPRLVRCDNDPEFTAHALRDWCRFSGAGTSYIEPARPGRTPTWRGSAAGYATSYSPSRRSALCWKPSAGRGLADPVQHHPDPTAPWATSRRPSTPRPGPTPTNRNSHSTWTNNRGPVRDLGTNATLGTSRRRSANMTETAVQIHGYIPGTYKLDPGHSDVAFTVRHMMVSKIRGHFTKVEADIVLAPNPLDSSATATIDPNSIDTNNPTRDDDLRSSNFFEVDKYPTINYRSTGVRRTEDGFDLDGELTIHGVTRPMTLALDVNGFTKDPYGGTRAGFSATGEIDRKEFDITTNIPMDGGGVVIGDTIQLFIEVEAVLQQPAEA